MLNKSIIWGSNCYYGSFQPCGAEKKAAAVFVLLWAWLGRTELIWAGPVWDDWVEPVWFLLPELCCLCRVFVPATQAPTVINSPGSLCMLTHTDKKWWRKKKAIEEGERVREDETREDRRTHTVAYVDTDGQRATAWTQKRIACAKKNNKTSKSGNGWQNTRLRL